MIKISKISDIPVTSSTLATLESFNDIISSNLIVSVSGNINKSERKIPKIVTLDQLINALTKGGNFGPNQLEEIKNRAITLVKQEKKDPIIEEKIKTGLWETIQNSMQNSWDRFGFKKFIMKILPYIFYGILFVIIAWGPEGILLLGIIGMIFYQVCVLGRTDNYLNSFTFGISLGISGNVALKIPLCVLIFVIMLGSGQNVISDSPTLFKFTKLIGDLFKKYDVTKIFIKFGTFTKTYIINNADSLYKALRDGITTLITFTISMILIIIKYISNSIFAPKDDPDFDSWKWIVQRVKKWDKLYAYVNGIYNSTVHAADILFHHPKETVEGVIDFFGSSVESISNLLPNIWKKFQHIGTMGDDWNKMKLANSKMNLIGNSTATNNGGGNKLIFNTKILLDKDIKLIYQDFFKLPLLKLPYNKKRDIYTIYNYIFLQSMRVTMINDKSLRNKFKNELVKYIKSARRIIVKEIQSKKIKQFKIITPIETSFRKPILVKGGKRRKRRRKSKKDKIRKHSGINQQTGRLKKGYKYSGKKLKSGLPKIIKIRPPVGCKRLPVKK